MVNVERLKTALKDKNITIERVACELSVDPATIYRRFNRQGEKFTVEEVAKLSKLLNLDGKTMQNIFFAK